MAMLCVCGRVQENWWERLLARSYLNSGATLDELSNFMSLLCHYK